jgi:hypothetical protein
MKNKELQYFKLFRDVCKVINYQTKSEVPTRHFTAGITGHFSAFHIDFLHVIRRHSYWLKDTSSSNR